jgi:hypothetical protein
MRVAPFGTLLVLLLGVWAVADDWKNGGLKGRVIDPLGSAVPDAVVSASGPSGGRTVKTDARGEFYLEGLAPELYTVSVTKDGFEPYLNHSVAVGPGSVTVLDVQLSLAPREERVTVRSTPPSLGLEPENNAGAIVIKGPDLDAIPDDPDEMAEALQALAGPAAGPNGGQIFVDGFTGGRLPPKASIREIRLNANPFSAEYDRLGYGRIEIFTKPGTEKFRGEASFRFNDQSLNTRNPFAPNKPPYQRRNWGGNVSGPLAEKKASYFIDFEKRDVRDNQIINATVLDAHLAAIPFNEAVLTPQYRTTVSPRLDWQISPSQTLSARYTYTSLDQSDAGVGGFSLPSRAYQTGNREHTFQLVETAVFGKVVSETRLRFWSEQLNETGDDSVPTLQVLDAFTGGGSQVGPSSNDQRRWELQNVTSWSRGKHSLRVGARLRTVSEQDVARKGFGGTVLFSGGLGPELDAQGHILLGPDGRPILVMLTSLERYRRTLFFESLGLAPSQIRALGGGASQLQIVGGDPAANVSQWDLAPFVQDDWHLTPNLLLSAGLRYEVQDNIDSHLDLAPRFGFAWSVGPKTPAGQARTIVRGGFGVFYDRFGEDLTLRARRFNGVRMQQYIVSDPTVLDQLRFDAQAVSGVPSVGDLAGFALPQTTWRVAPDLKAPLTLQSSLSIEQQLPRNFTLTGTFISAQVRRLLRSRNINAPLESGGRPLGAAAGEVYEIESTGRMNQYQFLVGVNNRLSPTLTLFFRYFLAWARSDTDGPTTFPANSYDLSSEYGRAATDVRHRVVLGGSVTVPGGIRLNPFVIISTGRPFNITIGRDLNRDSLFTDRPAFATDPAQAGVVDTPYGLLELSPTPGAVVIPRNFGNGPGFVMVNLRASKAISLGGKGGLAPPRGGQVGMRPPFEGGRGSSDEAGGGRSLTVSFSVQNLLNHTNPASPLGDLSSPLFGRSLSSAGGFGFGGSAGAGNRRIELQARISF